MRLNPKHPVYVISKGRWDSRLTARWCERAGVPYHIVVEPQERDQYAAVIDPAKILTLPFSNLGQGSIPARNWCWEHAISRGAAWHWILDDNIGGFSRLNRNTKVNIRCGNHLRAMEDFAERYENVVMAGPQYDFFAPRRSAWPAFYWNTRVYSCILLRNDLPFRWRGRYNEDTDLALRILKAGYCTVLFNAFLAKKRATMSMKGGNTDELYRRRDGVDGRLDMARQLQRQHPDVVTIHWRWGRWQHLVDYRPFRANQPRRRAGIVAQPEPNEYGLQLRRNGVPVAPPPLVAGRE